MGNLRARPAGCFMSGRARTKSRGQGRQSHRLIHVEIYVLATLIAVVPIGLVVLAVRFGPGLFALGGDAGEPARRSEEHTSELQSLRHLVCRLLLEKKNSTSHHL